MAFVAYGALFWPLMPSSRHEAMRFHTCFCQCTRMSCLVAADARLMQAWSPRSWGAVSGNAPARTVVKLLQLHASGQKRELWPVDRSAWLGARWGGAEESRRRKPRPRTSPRNVVSRNMLWRWRKICRGGAPSFPHHANTSVAGSYPS
jgi:hypothetical protein